MRYLYIWEIKSLSVISFAKIFSHSVAYLIVLFMVSLAAQKLLCLIRSYLSIYLFIFITPGGRSKNIVLQRMFCLCIKFFFFLWGPPKPSIWKFPGQGSNWSCSHWPMPQHFRIQTASVTYTIAQGNTRSFNPLSKARD